MSADKPSEQAIHVAKVLLHLQADKPLPVERLSAIIDEQHRNARAEAFEEAARCVEKMYRSEGLLERAGDTLYAYEGIVRRVRERDASAIRAIAAKERATPTDEPPRSYGNSYGEWQS